jgi:hypothetical protein
MSTNELFYVTPRKLYGPIQVCFYSEVPSVSEFLGTIGGCTVCRGTNRFWNVTLVNSKRLIRLLVLLFESFALVGRVLHHQASERYLNIVEVTCIAVYQEHINGEACMSLSGVHPQCAMGSTTSRYPFFRLLRVWGTLDIPPGGISTLGKAACPAVGGT